LLNSIYCHIWWSNHDNLLIIDDWHSSQQATTEDCLSPFHQLAGEAQLRRLGPEQQSGGSVVGGEGTTCLKRDPACSHWGRRVAEPSECRQGQGKLCGEVWPGDGDSTSSHRLSSQSGRCALHSDARTPATETLPETCRSGKHRHPCQHRASAPFAGTCEHRRTSPAAATLLSMVPLIMQHPANWHGRKCYSSATIVNKKLHACIAVMAVDGCAKCNYSRYISYMPMQSIVTIRNDVWIIDAHFTTLVSNQSQIQSHFSNFCRFYKEIANPVLALTLYKTNKRMHNRDSADDNNSIIRLSCAMIFVSLPCRLHVDTLDKLYVKIRYNKLYLYAPKR